MELHIKNMVCDRCKMVVETELERVGLKIVNVELGLVTLSEPASDRQLKQAKRVLHSAGFELLQDQKQKLVESIKNIIVEMVHYSGNVQSNLNHSEFIAGKLGKDYNYLSNLFSELEGSTIEKYLINQRIERVKELLEYNEQSLTEIANELGYSSVAYLSNQFKKVTGLTPSAYKSEKSTPRRKPLDKI